MPYMKSDLAILSAAQYDIGVPLPAMRTTRGSKRKIVSTPTSRPSETGEASISPSLPTVDDMEPPQPAGKKRAKRPVKAPPPPDSDDGEEECEDAEAEAETKRARGRPRVDVKDVTAADRRRTQIRLAQRAYRSRKEKAIVSLEKKVQSLKEANEAMSNAFMGLHDFAVNRGLLDAHPDLAEQLRQTTETFLEMARQSSADEDADENDEDDGGAARSSRAAEATRAFDKKQQAIADAVKIFGYQAHQAHQEMPDKSEMNPMAALPQALQSQMLMVPPPPASAPPRHAHQLQSQLYGGLMMQHSPSMASGGGSFDQGGLFDSAFSMAANVAGSLTNSPAGAGATSSYFSGAGSDNMTTVGSSNSSVLSVSPVPGNEFSLGGQFSFDGPSFPLFSTTWPPPPPPPVSTSDLGPHLADTDAFITSAAMGNPYASLPPPKYRVDTSFGLRLRHYAIESAYRLITNPNPPADAFARAFGFCIMFEPVEDIRQRLRDGLEHPMTTPSKFTRWELPFVTSVAESSEESSATVTAAAAARAAGGSAAAGMRSPGGGGRVPKNSSSDHRGTSVRPVTPRINVALPGFEGAFYDCEETEMYLQERGVHIPPDSESIIVEVDDADFSVNSVSTAISRTNSSTSANRGSSRSRSSHAGSSNHDGTVKGIHDHSSISSVISSSTGFEAALASVNGVIGGGGAFDYLSPDLIHKTGSARSGDPMDWSAGGGGGSGGGGPNVAGTVAGASSAARRSTMAEEDALMSAVMDGSMFSQFAAQPPAAAAFPQRRLLLLDVGKFLRELVRRGTCLGQTPGFRASDVNEAFWRATRNASTA